MSDHIFLNGRDTNGFSKRVRLNIVAGALSASAVSSTGVAQGSVGDATKVSISQTAGLTLIPVVENTWIDISGYVGKLIQFTTTSSDAIVEFSNDGIDPIPAIQSMNLNPTAWNAVTTGGNEWSTNYPAKYIRFPSLTPFVAGTLKLYGSFTPIERKNYTIVKEIPLGSLASAVVIGEDLVLDPFVMRTTLEGDTNGVQAVVVVEYSGRRATGSSWVMHTPAVLLGAGGTLAFTANTTGSADNAVILAPSQRVCAFFNRVSIYCTAGTVDVDIRSQQFGTWNLATLRRQSDNVLVTELVAGEVGILENVAFENIQVLQKGAIASNANVIFSDPLKESVPYVDMGEYSGAISVTSFSNAAVATLYLHQYY